jgi:hypothetical protein
VSEWNVCCGGAVPSSTVLETVVGEAVAPVPRATAPPIAANPATLAAPTARRVRRAG